MVQSLIGKIPEKLSKAFLHTGLIPTLLLLFIIFSYQNGFDYILQKVSSIDDDNWIDNAFWTILIITILAIAFFSLKELFFNFFERLPWGIISPLRNYLIQKNIKKREKLINIQQELEYKLTIITWYKKRKSAGSGKIPMPFEQPMFKPQFVNHVDVKDAIKSSKSLMKILTEFDQRKYYYPAAFEINKIIKLMSSFYVGGKSNYNESNYQTEITSFRNLIEQKPKIINILKRCENHLYREMEFSYGNKYKYPLGAWVRPTKFGNRVASIDDYTKLRYGIYTSVIWGRVWTLLNPADKSEVSETRLKMETYLNLIVSTIISGLMVFIFAFQGWWNAVVYVVNQKSSLEVLVNLSIDWISLIYFVATALLLYVFHGQLLFAVDGFKEKITSLIDMKRLLVLKAMGFKVETVEGEKEIFSKLQKFFVQNNHLQDDCKLEIPEG